jgi:hypothetical protein
LTHHPEIGTQRERLRVGFVGASQEIVDPFVDQARVERSRPRLGQGHQAHQKLPVGFDAENARLGKRAAEKIERAIPAFRM